MDQNVGRMEATASRKITRAHLERNSRQTPACCKRINIYSLFFSIINFKIWKRLLGVPEMKAQARENLYQELLMRARLVSRDIKQIDLDINRTYRDHLAFRRRYDVKFVIFKH